MNQIIHEFIWWGKPGMWRECCRVFIIRIDPVWMERVSARADWDKPGLF